MTVEEMSLLLERCGLHCQARKQSASHKEVAAVWTIA